MVTRLKGLTCDSQFDRLSASGNAAGGSVARLLRAIGHGNDGRPTALARFAVPVGPID